MKRVDTGGRTEEGLLGGRSRRRGATRSGGKFEGTESLEELERILVNVEAKR